MTREAPGRLPQNGQPPGLKALVRGYFGSVFGDCDVRGLEHVPLEGPLVIASTHRSYLDPIILGAFIPRPIFFFAKSELFENPIWRTVNTAFGGFSVDREKAGSSTFRVALDLLRQGEALTIFPEGGIVDSLTEQGFKEGVGFLSALSGARILPIYLSGTNTLFSWPDGLTDRTRMVLHAGELIDPAGRRGKAGRAAISGEVAGAMEELRRNSLPPPQAAPERREAGAAFSR
jgi:1-acyl-sn-glycerol-3-phosphate acyltransferase